MNDMNEAFVRGFVKKALEFGLTQDEALNLTKSALMPMMGSISPTMNPAINPNIHANLPAPTAPSIAPPSTMPMPTTSAGAQGKSIPTTVKNPIKPI